VAWTLNIGMNDRVLAYHDCLLRVRDVALLTGKRSWLNDQLLTFFFAYLREERYSHLQEEVALVDCSLSFLVANLSPEDAQAVLKPLKLEEKSLVLFQVGASRMIWGAGWGATRLALLGPLDTPPGYNL